MSSALLSLRGVMSSTGDCRRQEPVVVSGATKLRLLLFPILRKGFLGF